MSLPRITSRTPLRDSSSPFLEKAAMPLSPPPSPIVSFIALKNPRKARNRISLLVFLSLFFISLYIFFVQGPTLSSNRGGTARPTLAQALDAMKNSRLAVGETHRKPYSNLPPIQLSTDQELAAVSSFLASLSSNVIPPTVDPSRPIDPQLVLEFDTRSSKAAQEVDAMVEDVWTRNPVMLYSKLYSPISREIKSTLMSMNLRPAPAIFDVDIRDDADVLRPMLVRLTSSSDLPILLIGGKPIRSIAEFRDMAESGELQRRIREAGAVSIEKKKKNKK
ncbi:hypothetical protein D9757_010174 [Collybiopsis confluens]|uniref:Glutaredoxin-like protein n=1 Tax=Collybiopsis confluens TaxID=2823264 RepID=A0A8H5H067_9AGAR|nr:hypothetical protein D9757_010174 [Collybiopsis confluens]